MLLIIIIIIAISGIIYASIQAYKAWGVFCSLLVLAGLGALLFIPLLGSIAAIILSIVVISKGRSAIMKRIVNKTINRNNNIRN